MKVALWLAAAVAADAFATGGALLRPASLGSGPPPPCRSRMRAPACSPLFRCSAAREDTFGVSPRLLCRDLCCFGDAKREPSRGRSSPQSSEICNNAEQTTFCPLLTSESRESCSNEGRRDARAPERVAVRRSGAPENALRSAALKRRNASRPGALTRERRNALRCGAPGTF
jgi:hypothetical protein